MNQTTQNYSDLSMAVLESLVTEEITVETVHSSVNLGSCFKVKTSYPSSSARSTYHAYTPPYVWRWI